MIYPKIPLAQSVIAICQKQNIQHIVISPGSRNAPLTIGFTNNPFFKCYSIADERCAAFFALGIAQQTKQTVAVVCTSGSALLNYYPAFAEAFYSQIPLVVLSADRPQSKIDIGDGQTIRQENVFANHSLFNANLTENASPENDYLIQKALFTAKNSLGPVHINVPFEEPLYETIPEPIYLVSETVFEEEIKTEINISQFVDIWNTSAKKMILIGGDYPNEIDQKIINQLAENQSVVILTEVTSNVHHENIISAIDTLITPFSVTEFENFRPDLLITLGGMIVSKRIKTFLRSYKPKNHWHINELRAYNTFDCLTEHVKQNPNIFFKAIFKDELKIESNYLSNILKIKQLREIKSKEYLNKIPFSDLKVFEIIHKNLPENCMLQISNSSPIRYAQLLPLHKSIDVYCNRGTSGIDGSTSTAIGASVVTEKQTIFITGDISFLYDSNALWNNYIPNNFVVLLINNGGGGIFRILPGHAENETFNTYFETSHCLTAKQLAQMYNFDYEVASETNELKLKLNKVFKNDKKIILEIFTPTKTNNTILLDYFNK